MKHEFPILEIDTEQKAVIMPNRGNLYELPQKCVFAFLGDTVDAYAMKNNCEIVAKFESITKVYPIYKVIYKDEEITMCQAPCGASASTLILDFLIGYGVKHIIATGSCGALHDFAEDEIIIPTSALRDEGTSYHYIAPSREIELNKIAIKAIEKSLHDSEVNYKLCKTWTTDGFFRETKDMVIYRKSEGCEVVEMECAALAACAEFRKAIFGQILFTADSLANVDLHDERNWGNSSFEKALLLSFEAVLQIGK